MGLDLDDELIGVVETSGNDEIVLASRNGLAIRFNEEDVRPMGRSARGVRGMNLRGDDRVVALVATGEDASLLTVCENGYGKRTQVAEYRKTRRGGKGVINIKVTQRNGHVVSVLSVTDTDEVMLITAKGIVLRTDLSQVREIGRATQGVRLMRPEEGDHVVAAARVIQEDENGQEPAQAPADNEADAPGDGPEAAGPEPQAGEASESQEP